MTKAVGEVLWQVYESTVASLPETDHSGIASAALHFILAFEAKIPVQASRVSCISGNGGSDGIRTARQGDVCLFDDTGARVVHPQCERVLLTATSPLTDVFADKMLHDVRMAAMRKLRRSVETIDEGPET